MGGNDPVPSQELHSRDALAPVFAELNKSALCRTEHDLYLDHWSSYWRNLLSDTSRYR